jgi:hypothetical protein
MKTPAAAEFVLDPRFFVDEDLVVGMTLKAEDGSQWALRDQGWDLRRRDMIRARRNLQAFLERF